MYIFIAIAVIAVILLIAILSKSSPKAKGKQGEAVAFAYLGDTKEGKQYIINDLLFETGKGMTCQIDHILINENGIWVIETKNYSGRIYGNETQREWTQILAYGNVKNKFYNPVRQNATHVYRLAEYLNADNLLFRNVVVFHERADISNVSAANVFFISDLPRIVRQKTNVNLSAEMMETYYNRLKTLKTETKTDSKEHIKHIAEMQCDIERGICPRCGGRLILRNGKYGRFYGCSNYPKCSFKKPLH